MHRMIRFAPCLLMMGCASVKDTAPVIQPLTIRTTCEAGMPCVFTGEDVPVTITITNTTASPVGFPLAFVQKTGPSIRLSDPRTREKTNLRTNLADFTLKDAFTPIPPGKSIVLRWIVFASELRSMGGTDVDLMAEISVYARIGVNGQSIEFTGVDTLRIVEKRVR